MSTRRSAVRVAVALAATALLVLVWGPGAAYAVAGAGEREERHQALPASQEPDRPAGTQQAPPAEQVKPDMNGLVGHGAH
jgi:hypothetical protein